MTAKSSKSVQAQRYVIIVRWLGVLFFASGVLINLLGRSGLFASPQAQAGVDVVRKFYDGIFRAIMVTVSSYCSIAYLKLKQGTVSKFYKLSLTTFSVLTIILIGIMPLAVYWDLYLMLMPFPNSTPISQLRYLGNHYDHTFTKVLGAPGLKMAIYLYFGYHIVAYVGTLLMGRRWYCSMLCMLVGNHAESFGLGLPVIPHNKRRPLSKIFHPTAHKVLKAFQVITVALAVVVVGLWALNSLWGLVPVPLETIVTIERISSRVFTLLFMSVLMVFFGGRAYCVYCPAGILFGTIGRLAGQRINTDLTECIGCGKCNEVCKMSLDIQAAALAREPLRSINCVGCGLCVDTCPKGTLAYSTFATSKLERVPAGSASKTS